MGNTAKSEISYKGMFPLAAQVPIPEVCDWIPQIQTYGVKESVKSKFMEEMNMKNYKILSKAILAICLFGIILTIINSFTGFINSSISTSGTIICISSFIVAGVAIMLLENRRIKTVKRDR